MTENFPRSRAPFKALALGLALLLSMACSKAPEFVGTLQEPLLPGPSLESTNWDGQPFQIDDVRGKVAIVFFGYTYCPDVCPFALAKMKQLYSKLGDRAEEVAIVFVSVDPHRDSVEKLSRYVPNFDRRFYGLHMSFDQLDNAIEALTLTVQYGQPKDGPGSDSFYYVDHTGSYFLIDREGRLHVKHPPNATVAQLLPDVEILLASKE
ncbi:MAG: SCO family protein [Deltaproteobacteria bacterium]|nr:SCO family protein [Deltaproteobacteria bacterium]